MGVGRFLVGVVFGAVALVAIAIGARALRKRYLPDLSGPVVVLAEIILGLALVVCVSEALGTVGLFRFAPLVVAFAGVGLAAARFARTDGVESHPSDPPIHIGRTERFAALAAIAILGAQWSSRIVDSLQRGMVSTDTMWYHMPVAARFAQTGFTSHLHYADGNSLTLFFPSTSELLHGIGIVFMGNDMLSPFLNLGWLALALLAAWCIGQPFGVAPIILIGIAVVFATPELLLDDAGTALTDVVGVALLLSSIALLFHTKHEGAASLTPSPIVGIAALAAGLALSTKFTLVPAVGVLSLAVVFLTARGARVRQTALWFGGVAITGSYWYLRNLFTVGNPLPSLQIGLGPFHLPHVPFPGASKLADYLFDYQVWVDYLVPGLRTALGPAWWVLLLLGFAGFAFGIVRAPNKIVRGIGVVGLVSLVAFVYSPQILGFRAREPVFFVVNVRYIAPALAVGVAVLPIATARYGRRALLGLLGVFGIVLVATQFDRTIWHNRFASFAPPTQGTAPRVWGVIIGAVILVAGLAWHRLGTRRRAWRASVWKVAPLVVVVAIGGWFVGHSYLDNRYTDAPPMPAVYRWARNVHDARIASVAFNAQYPLYGLDLSNRVQYVARRTSNHRSFRIATCQEWREALNRGRYRYVVATNPGYPYPSKLPSLEINWTASDPAARLLVREGHEGGVEVTVFRIERPLDPGSCSRRDS